jgi:murein DD-endopeptidase MepM/ murein hydrolase activator NlpD
MKRLVYSPKAFVYIQTDEGFYNISDLVISGNVHRKINQVSTAEVTFKNPFKQFTKPGNPTFRPMDRITIFLQRIPGVPVQVFTGYLDEAPYFQMYPGTCTIKASCTLKRLMFTYFDPGVPFMMAFMNKYGWTLGPDGMLNKAHKGSGSITVDQAQGSSIAQLLFAVLRHIGGWTGNREVFIDELPTQIVTRLTRIYDVLAKEEKEALDDFEQFLKEYIGTSSQGDGGGDVDLANISLDKLTSEQNEVLDTLMSVADSMNASEKFCLAAISTGIVEANLTNPSGGDLSGTPGAPATRKSAGWRQETEASYPGVDRTNIKESARRFYNECKQLDKGQSAAELAADVQRPAEQYRGRYAEHMAEAKKLYKQYMDKKGDKESETSSGPRDSGPSNNDQEKSGGDKKRDSGAHNNSSGRVHPVGKKFGKSGAYGEDRGDHQHAGEDYPAPEGTPVYAATDGTVHTFPNSTTGYGNYIDVDGGSVWTRYGHLSKIVASDGDEVKAGDLIGKVGSTGHSSGPHLHFEVRSSESFGFQGTVDPSQWLEGSANPDGSSDAPESGDASGGTADALTASKAGGILTTFNIGQGFDQAESLLLQGDKSLMNDQPLLPFVEELCKGSMRNFMSMPDGSFYAFHPDYFGSYSGKPYWQINDIEVMEGGIQLSDDALATHIYVTGDWLGGGNAEDIALKLQTHGVVNILNAGAADFLNIDPHAARTNNDDSKTKGKKGTKEADLEPFLGDPDSAIEFLKRYGARPHVENPPFIRSHLFETFYAFQLFMLMWARQFLTTFTFTFMPELYPGGIVAFPEHGVQMYIDEVHHTFDYSSGFTTQANLSAPAAMPFADKGTAAISRGMVRGGVLATRDD